MGWLWTVLYIAFGGVAVWLLAEVLLQYKARLRWRLLAFGGFTTVVIGVVALSSVVVISLGAAAFAVGQTFVTLSYRRGFAAGWALGGLPGTSRRRRETHSGQADADPSLEVSGLEVSGVEVSGGEAHPEGFPPAYRPEPMPDDTGQYGVYGRDDRSGEPPGPSPEPGRPDHYGAADHDRYGQYAGPYDQGYGYGGPGEQGEQYPAYTDPYAGGPGTPAQPQYGGQYGDQYGDQYATASYDQQPYPSDGYGTDYSAGYPAGYSAYPGDPYAGADTGQAPYGQQTPPGGVWVPPQRGEGQPDGLTADQPYPQGDGSAAADTGDGHGYGSDGRGAAYGTDGYGTGYHYGDQQPRY